MKIERRAFIKSTAPHRSITPGHLGYVSQTLGRALNWDPGKEKVTGDKQADKLLKSVETGLSDFKTGLDQYLRSQTLPGH